MSTKAPIGMWRQFGSREPDPLSKLGIGHLANIRDMLRRNRSTLTDGHTALSMPTRNAIAVIRINAKLAEVEAEIARRKGSTSSLTSDIG